MFCYRDYQLTTRLNQQNEKSTSNSMKMLFNPVKPLKTVDPEMATA